MVMKKYDFFIAGRWRNFEQVQHVLDIVRSHGKSAYCFIENSYQGKKVEFHPGDSVEEVMQQLENFDINDELVQEIFSNDMRGQREADAFLLVLPGGTSSHIEAGVAYGLGMKCYAVGTPEKTETLYQIFEEIFPSSKALSNWLVDESDAS